MLPLQMALESKNTKLGQTALTGMQVDQRDGSILWVLNDFSIKKKKCIIYNLSSLCFLFNQKLLCEDRFMGQETELLDKQLLSQMLEAIRVTPSLHEDLQVEVMKVRSPDSSM